MVQGVALSETERCVILALANEVLSAQVIPGQVNRVGDAVLMAIQSWTIRDGRFHRAVKRKPLKRCTMLTMRQREQGSMDPPVSCSVCIDGLCASCAAAVGAYRKLKMEKTRWCRH